MRIQKKFQGTVPKNKILNTHSDSETDTYSCNKINELISSGTGTGTIDFEGDVIFDFAGTYYETIKTAIELDIQANQPYTNNTFLNDIIELLFGGVVVASNGIGVGLSSLVGNIAIQEGAMSSFMSIILIFGGIALAFALSRWVVNLIGSLGQRNR